MAKSNAHARIRPPPDRPLHDRWATTQLLSACANLTPDQFHQRFDIGPGSLHDTLKEQDPAPASKPMANTAPPPNSNPSSKNPPTTSQSNPPASPSQPSPPAASATAEPSTSLAAILTQVPTHSMHHRAQCLNMLRHLGVTPLPPSGVVEWTWLGETQK